MTGLETLQQDFVEALQKIMPDCVREGIYLHPGPKALAFAEKFGEDARGCHNTDAHLRSQLIGRSETVAVLDGAPDLGTFGHVFLIDFDTTRQRARPKDTMKRKQFIKGTEQIAQEGAIQIFRKPETGMEEVIVGVVGTLQFDVFQYRMRRSEERRVGKEC